MERQRKWDEAITEYREAIRIKPDYADARNGLGWALYNQKKVDEAITEYREAIRIDSGHEQAHINMHLALVKQGKVDEAITELRKAIRIAPKAASLRSLLAWILSSSADRTSETIHEALMHARNAVELAPTDWSYRNSLSLAEYRGGNWNEALTACNKSMELRKGGDANDWFILAMIHWQLDEKEEATSWFDRSVSWAKEHGENDSDLRILWTEAATLLGQSGPPAAESK